jgi:hypothetical protein
MGDHRMSIKIDASFHGVKDSVDMWINFVSGQCDGVDDRVLDFFKELYAKGMVKYDRIAAQEHRTNAAQASNTQSTQCLSCGAEHDENFTYCPWCGFDGGS